MVSICTTEYPIDFHKACKVFRNSDFISRGILSIMTNGDCRIWAIFTMCRSRRSTEPEANSSSPISMYAVSDGRA